MKKSFLIYKFDLPGNTALRSMNRLTDNEIGVYCNST